MKQLTFMLCFIVLSVPILGQTFPKLNRPIVQQYPVLNEADQKELEDRILAIQEKTGSQIGIAIVPSTKPLQIEEYSIKLAEKWKLGRKGIDDGILIVIAKLDRTVRLEIGYGLEGAIPDAIAKQIIDIHLTPNFKYGLFKEGLLNAINYLEQKIQNESLPSPKEQQQIEFEKRNEEFLKEMTRIQYYEYFVYFNFLIAFGLGIFLAKKQWNIAGFILPGLYLSILLLIGQIFVSGYFSEGYFVFFPASLGYAIIYFFVNFKTIDKKYGSVKSAGGPRSKYRSSSSSRSYSSSSSSYSSRSSSSSSRSYSGGGGSFGGGGASGSW